ncbi:indole-3-glycerol phosphate synthase TrpC [Persicirhabdus sediminis]|uniref:Indole-3-glycerol phosphate synthase n=1 Tax=Persicirhabdus sediminis TaxID=454144 RepID=A0A8J7MED8_9BACT|nr:indole-3-glycerol phosphate synthase TrpC [Persicirhabdus sediminis]MBK1791751.1 indole-3-glycerol phosphate synthase TrpC [Persicirhabdus sediminis]
MSILDEIIAQKHKEVELLMPRIDMLRAAALNRNDFGGFRSALDRGPNQLGIIAEVKKASPSAGIIDPNFDAEKQARMYLDGGASCMSILTDEKYFQGSLSYLTQISRFSDIPLLRKDFMVHEAQIYEAIISGADAILLIVAALDDKTLNHLYETALDFQLDVLVEVHNKEEMYRAIDLGSDLIGINNRNLKTFVTDLAVTEELAAMAPDDCLLVSESGLKTTADVQRVLDAGANAILVGETLMKENDPAVTLAEWAQLTRTQPAS